MQKQLLRFDAKKIFFSQSRQFTLTRNMKWTWSAATVIFINYLLISDGYQFNYLITDDQSGFNYGHAEEDDGISIAGEYHVQLPNGGQQRVTYKVNKGQIILSTFIIKNIFREM